MDNTYCNVVGVGTSAGVVVGVTDDGVDRGGGTLLNGRRAESHRVRANGTSDAVSSGEHPTGVDESATAREGAPRQPTTLPRPLSGARRRATNDVFFIAGEGTQNGGSEEKEDGVLHD